MGSLCFRGYESRKDEYSRWKVREKNRHLLKGTGLTHCWAVVSLNCLTQPLHSGGKYPSQGQPHFPHRKTDTQRGQAGYPGSEH